MCCIYVSATFFIGSYVFASIVVRIKCASACKKQQKSCIVLPKNKIESYFPFPVRVLPNASQHSLSKQMLNIVSSPCGKSFK